jgi:hypothetical protein
MNLYLGGTIGMVWVIGVLIWGHKEWKVRAGSTSTPTPAT